MKKYFVMLLMLFIFCSCAAGPVYVAKNESESIKSVYLRWKITGTLQ